MFVTRLHHCVVASVVLLHTSSGLELQGDDNRVAFGLNRPASSDERRASDTPAKSLWSDPAWRRTRAEQFLLRSRKPVTRSNLDKKDFPELQRIVGGVPSEEGEFPGCVFVKFSGGFCTGTLVAPRVVVSAAHCLVTKNGLNRGAESVVYGLKFDDVAKTVKVGESIPHPRYDRETSANDVAVLILEKPINDITPHEIADEDLFSGGGDFGKLVTLVGYGFTEGGEAGKQFNVEVPYITSGCESYGCFGGLEFAAGEEQHSKDSCNGDSGGPAFATLRGQNVLTGITSRAVRSATTVTVDGLLCGDGGIYVRADKYFDFFQEQAVKYQVEPPSRVSALPVPSVTGEKQAREELIKALSDLVRALQE